VHRDTCHGLPGLVADSLPDHFGNALIDLWLEQQGRSAAEFTPVERLCYIGMRGMGRWSSSPRENRDGVKYSMSLGILFSCQELLNCMFQLSNTMLWRGE
jgi:hypothetical protein